MVGVRGAPKTLAGVPRRGAPERMTTSDYNAESARLDRLAKVREWDMQGLVCMIPFYSVAAKPVDMGPRRETVMQAVRVGGVFFEEPENVFPSETMFANLALAVKAGVTDHDQSPQFSMRLPGDRK